MVAMAERLQRKLNRLPKGLRAEIIPEGRDYVPDPETPVSNYLVHTMRHCNGGKTVDAALRLRRHCDEDGMLFVTLAGAASSFQIGAALCPLIKAGKVAAISATGANMEESIYRLVAHGCYRRIPRYAKLTSKDEQRLDRVGFRRITDTYLPEEESVRLVYRHLMKLWREAEKNGEQLHWHEFFFRLFDEDLIEFDTEANPEECWLYMAWKHDVKVVVPGWEDSTMGNIFTHATYGRSHPMLGKHKLKRPIGKDVVRHNFEYMHDLAEWYLDITEDGTRLAFVQLGGGIAGDFPICVVPHLKHDFFHGMSVATQEALVASWAGFVEIHATPMSYGSYSGAGFDEKITWSKLNPESFGYQIDGDFTVIFPLLSALILRR